MVLAFWPWHSHLFLDEARVLLSSCVLRGHEEANIAGICSFDHWGWKEMRNGRLAKLRLRSRWLLAHKLCDVLMQNSLLRGKWSTLNLNNMTKWRLFIGEKKLLPFSLGKFHIFIHVGVTKRNLNKKSLGARTIRSAPQNGQPWRSPISSPALLRLCVIRLNLELLPRGVNNQWTRS